MPYEAFVARASEIEMTSKPPASTRTRSRATGVAPQDTAAGGATTAPYNEPLSRRRADAVQNRARLLEAADFKFMSEGVDVSLDAIAAHAGVARATLFRNFPDRHALITGLLDRALCDIEIEATRIDGDPGALWRILRYIGERTILHGPLKAYWQTLGRDSPEIQAAVLRFLAAIDKPVAWAVADRACRRDLTAPDMLLLVSLLDGVQYGKSSEQRLALTSRAWEFVAELAQLRNMDM